MKIISSIPGLIGGLFKGVKTPKIASPVLPDPGSSAARIAAQKKVTDRKKAGREGTIYTGAYQNANLAGTA